MRGMIKSDQRVRWWPAILIVLAATAVIGAIWLVPDLMRQRRVVVTMLTGLVSVLLLFAWACIFSGFPRSLRWIVFGAVVAVAALGGAVLRIRGMSGDLVPLFAFRWSQEPTGAVASSDTSTFTSSTSSETSSETSSVTSSAAEIGRFDFPQFLGPQRRATVEGVRLARDWKTAPPRLVWRRPIGVGWSSFAVVGGRAYTQEQRGNEELVVCYDLETGRVVWVHADPGARFSSVIGGDGPRATPTVTSKTVHTLGATGHLSCFDRQSGERLWTRDVVGDNGAQLPEWGTSSSPLIHGDLVVVSAGGAGGRSLVAYGKDSGEPAWRGADEEPSYSSPVFARLAGRDQILILNRWSLTAHAPSGGRTLWRYPWDGEQPNVAVPLAVGGDRVFVSSGYGAGCALLHVRSDGQDRLTAEPLWKNRNLKAKFTNVVSRGGFVYGLDDGVLVCLDLADGKRRWKNGRFGHGQMLLVEDLLLLTTERGEAVLVDPSPEELHELGRFQVLEGRTWPTPALSKSYLLVRSDTEAACYELALEAGGSAQRQKKKREPDVSPSR